MKNTALVMLAVTMMSSAYAVEYVGGERFTFSDGSQLGGVQVSSGEIATWTSKSSVNGPIYGISITFRRDIKERRPRLGKGAGNAYPVHGAIFLPDLDALLASDKAADVIAAAGLTGDPTKMAGQARTVLAAIRAEAMKRIKP